LFYWARSINRDRYTAHERQNEEKKMASANVRWVSGKQFVGTDSTKHSVVLSTPDEGVGMKPSDMLLVGLAGCTAVDVVEILAKKRTPLSSLEIQTTATQDEDAPWTFRKFHMKYIVKGKGLTEKSVEQAISLSEEKYCSVAATVRGVAEITTEFEILPED
jgi:putative redox protein